MNKLQKGFVQVYTGNGKGKTTAALGQALRASGRGLKTLIIHFMKNYPYGEVEAIRNLSEYIKLEQYGDDAFVLKKQPPSDKDKASALNAVQRAKDAMLRHEFDIIILDEICVTFYFNLLKVEDVLPLFEVKPDDMEMILTGRYCPEELIKRADLVTEMKEIKHYYQKGILSRKGIDS